MPNVMVVDDSAVDRGLIAGLLNRHGEWSVSQADSGANALAQLEQSPAEVVVTDLNMPQMDGLDLVRAIQLQYPEIPVILITGQGSEGLAIEALEQGAASYVPKSRLNEMLVETVEQVLSITRADRSYSRLINCLHRAEFDFSLENDTGLVDPLVDLLQQMVSGMGLCDAIWRVRVGVALEQALLNALFRGNLEISAEEMLQNRESLLEGSQDNIVAQRCNSPPYKDRRIHVDIKITPTEGRFVIRDDGPGFDTLTIPAPRDPTALEREGGRGLVLIQTFMDRVEFNEKGNQVTMIKHRQTDKSATG